MVSDLTEACNLLARKLPQAHRYVAERDTDGTATHGKPGSKPPWNPQAAMAFLDAHEGARRLEASLRTAVTGRPGQRRGGSTANTFEALKAITRLEAAIEVTHEPPRDDGRPCQCGYCRAVRLVLGWSAAIERLPAIDTGERWMTVRDAACPYCQHKMLRVARSGPREGRITCLRVGCCFDGDGVHPVGTITVGERSGDPMIAWADGYVQHAMVEDDGTVEAA